MKTKSKTKPAPAEPQIEIINAVVGDVELYYAYDMPNHISVYFKKNDGTFELENEYFAVFHYDFNFCDDNEKNWGKAMSKFMELFCEFSWRFKTIIGTPMRLKIKRLNLKYSASPIIVSSIGHITNNKWLVSKDKL